MPLSGSASRSLATLLALIALTVAAPLQAHEKGVLTLASRELSPGDSVRIAGARFTKRASLVLTLVGVPGSSRLGEVRTDSAGAFAVTLFVPTSTVPGTYRLVATAADGDQVAALDVVVLAAVATHAPGAHAAAPAVARPGGERLVLDRARGPMMTGAVLAGIILALAAGAALLRRPHPPL
jgi:hypothetical protein